MRAMILSAGRGERMRPLTDQCPKPLAEIHDQALIVYHLKACVRAGIREIVVNVSHLKDELMRYLGTGAEWGVEIVYSIEDEPLEWAGGIIKALPLLGPEPFLAVSADIYTNMAFSRLTLAPAYLAHLVLVDNPDHHPLGDFGLAAGLVSLDAKPRFNFAGIGLYRPELFQDEPIQKMGFSTLMRPAIAGNTISGEHFQGSWYNVGTLAQLAALNASEQLRERS